MVKQPGNKKKGYKRLRRYCNQAKRDHTGVELFPYEASDKDKVDQFLKEIAELKEQPSFYSAHEMYLRKQENFSSGSVIQRYILRDDAKKKNIAGFFVVEYITEPQILDEEDTEATRKGNGIYFLLANLARPEYSNIIDYGNVEIAKKMMERGFLEGNTGGAETEKLYSRKRVYSRTDQGNSRMHKTHMILD